MPSGLTVQRSQQLDLMLLKSNVELSLRSGAKVPVTRGASLSVSGLARGAVTILKNSSPPKLIGGAVITGALALIPGASVDPTTGQLRRVAGAGSFTYWLGNNSTRWGTFDEACRTYNNPFISEPYGSDGAMLCRNRFGGNGWTIRPSTISCPYGHTNYHCNSEPQAPLPFAQSDYDALESVIPASDPSPDAVRDFWFDLCSGDGACMGSYTSDPTLSGPASVQGPKTTTTSTGPNGTTTTTTETHHDLDYSNPDGVVVRDRTTTTTTDPDGNISTDTTVDSGPVVGLEPDDQFDLDGSFSDSPFPEVEPFYEQKYPEGLEGVWSARKAEFEDSAFMDFLGSFVPSFSGSCPAWSFNVNVASWASFGIHEFQSLCWVFDFIKVVMLVTAAFLCRALIFGG